MEKDKRIFGTSICCTSGGVFKSESIKRFILLLEKIGYNYLEIGMEDLFDIKDEPYFGYLRGKYSREEIRDVVSFGLKHHVEVVPSIQTLAHFTHLVKIPNYYEIVDVKDILLVGHKKTYELLEKIFRSCREYFSTDKINIGFDEAELVGLGRYLDINGYQNRFDILLNHLNKVCQIASKYGFKPHMWSDMFFKMINHGEYYGKNLHLNKDIVERIPEDVELVYWDYLNRDNDLLNDMFRAHKETNVPFWFACSAIVHNGFAPLNTLSIEIFKNSIWYARKYGVKNYIVTLWGDDGNECSFFNALPSLLAAYEFMHGRYDMAKIKERFNRLFHLEFDDFMLLDLPNKSPLNQDLLKVSNPCKSLLYNDCFLGIKDNALKKEGHIPYEEYSKILQEKAGKMKKFKQYFITLSALCEALSFKAELGVKTREAYKKNDIEALKKLLSQYDDAVKGIKHFHAEFRKQWNEDNKPFGWEIHEARLGGLESRVKNCRDILKKYCDGKIKKIPELEADILEYSDWGLQYNFYSGLVSTGSH